MQFGEISIDSDKMVVARNDTTEIIELPNGCACCDVQAELVDSLHMIVRTPALIGTWHAPLACLLLKGEAECHCNHSSAVAHQQQLRTGRSQFLCCRLRGIGRSPMTSW